MELNDILVRAAQEKASDVHLSANNPVFIRKDGELEPLGTIHLTAEKIECFIKILLSEDKHIKLIETGQVDIAHHVDNQFVYRINIYKYFHYFGMACRIISDSIPTIAELELPENIEAVSQLKSGLVLVTGPTGCGKSTTIATIIDTINKNKKAHILTIEDPIEYIHRNKKSIVTQREVGRDCLNFSEALRAGLRQDPDVIMVGEMRDLETISTAITAAETGHLVLATLHTRNAHQTIERIIDVFPAQHQQQIRVQLAGSLMAVFCQRLVPRRNGGRIAAVESLMITPAVRNLIRESKVHQLYSFIQTGQRNGMQTMDSFLIKLYNDRLISRTTLIENAIDAEAIQKQIL